MKDGVAVTGGTDIDALDAQFAALVYPKPSGWTLLAAPLIVELNESLA